MVYMPAPLPPQMTCLYASSASGTGMALLLLPYSFVATLDALSHLTAAL